MQDYANISSLWRRFDPYDSGLERARYTNGSHDERLAMLDEARREEGLRHLQRGLALARANRADEAADALRMAVAANPNLREAHIALGFHYQRSGLLAKAADEFHTVANLEGDFLAYFNLGYVLVELARYEDALDAFRRCLELQPNDSATHLEIGYIHFNRGEFKAALDHLQHPLHTYPEDWEVHNLLGKCYLGLRQYDLALQSFAKALNNAAFPNVQMELLENINTVVRHREFRNLSTVKDQFYAQEGAVYLGSAQDDGLQVTELADYHFTYSDVATTLQRFLALYHSSGWQFTAVVAVDTLSRPLAMALSQLLQIPLRPFEDLHEADRALLAVAVLREDDLLVLISERVHCSITAFCLGLNLSRHGRMQPDVIGIATRGACSVPWESELRRLRADGVHSSQINECIDVAMQQITDSVRETPLDNNLPRQIRYYTRTHRRLNVAPKGSS